MSLQLITPPAVEPVTLADAKLHLKVDTSDDDALIARLIIAARARAEWHTGRALNTQSWILWLDGWPLCAPIEIALPPLQGVSSVTVYAPNDSASVIDPAAYQVDAASAPARLALKSTVLPPINLRAMNAVAVAFTAGYGSAATDVPAGIRDAILELTAFLYEHRGEAPAELPLDILALLSPFRVLHL
ncbi:MAG: phage head-tail connector protein [Alphaproteobacteria bacterium]|nr:phage head-tail connector protein [Alphaproteobacteria bacterium]